MYIIARCGNEQERCTATKARGKLSLFSRDTSIPVIDTVFVWCTLSGRISITSDTERFVQLYVRYAFYYLYVSMPWFSFCLSSNRVQKSILLINIILQLAIFIVSRIINTIVNDRAYQNFKIHAYHQYHILYRLLASEIPGGWDTGGDEITKE